ncbi:MAG: hypothetical protein FWD98_06450, partial [Defluviitaleaceae bacterium]|nr:hypothetical protein [Defluviitaleaceae bacterium]
MLARNMTFAAMLAAAFAVRLAFSVSGLAFQIDMNTFMAWSERVVNVGMREFYSPYIFTDYPPGYMYVLFILGRLRALLDLSFGSAAHTVLMMMPAILADLTTGAVLYRLALQQLPRHNAALLAAAYLFNPVIILNSAVWGQVDSVFVLPILLSLVGLTRRNYLAAYLLYAAAILIKPQALIFAPVYLFSFLIVLQDHGVKDGLAKLVRWGAACAALAVAVMLPFSQGFNILPILAQYIDTMTHYAWASVNAYNFHALAGAVWRPQDTLFLGFVPHFVIGHASIVAVTLLSLYLLWRDHIAVPIFNRNSYNPANIFFTAALLCAVVFVFSVRMHERYLYPAIPLLMLVYMFRPDKRILVLLAGFTLTNTVNVIDALNMLNAGVDTSLLVNLRWASGLNIVLAVTMVYLAFNLFGANYAAPYPAKAAAKPAANLLPFEKKLSAYSGRLSACIEKYEWRMLAGLVIVYAVIAFSRLGDFHAPQSFWDMRQHREESDWFTGWTPREPEDVAFNLGEYTFINRLLVYLGPRHNQEFSIFISGADRQWHHYRDFNLHSVFAWHDFGVNIHAHYIFVRPASTGLIIGEMGFKHNDRLITPPGMSHHPLFDEQHLVPPHPHFMNSTYFDEIYHPRTAYEFIHGMFVFENTHPPLGKVIKSWGIRAFGMTPFGWRFSGTFV